MPFLYKSVSFYRKWGYFRAKRVDFWSILIAVSDFQSYPIFQNDEGDMLLVLIILHSLYETFETKEVAFLC